MSREEIGAFVIDCQIKKREVCPEGSYNAVLATIHDLGVQPSLFKDSGPTRKLAFMFEVDASDDHKPFVLSKLVGVSLHEKSHLRGIVAACRGSDLTADEQKTGHVNLGELIGKPCIVTVTSKANAEGNVKAIIAHVARHVRGMPVMKPTLDTSVTPEWVTRMCSQAISTAA